MHNSEAPISCVSKNEQSVTSMLPQPQPLTHIQPQALCVHYCPLLTVMFLFSAIGGYRVQAGSGGTLHRFLSIYFQHLSSKRAWISELLGLAGRGGHTIVHARTRVTFLRHKALRIRSDIILFSACAFWAPQIEGTLLGRT